MPYPVGLRESWEPVMGDFLHDAGLVIVGGLMTLLGTLISNRHQRALEKATRWLEHRKETYASLMGAARSIRVAFGAWMEQGGAEPAKRMDLGIQELNHAHEQTVIVGSQSTFEAAQHLRDWCEDAAIYRPQRYSDLHLSLHLSQAAPLRQSIESADRRDRGTPGGSSSVGGAATWFPVDYIHTMRHL